MKPEGPNYEYHVVQGVNLKYKMYKDYLFPFKTIPLFLIKTRTLKSQKHLIFLTLKNHLLQETFHP